MVNDFKTFINASDKYHRDDPSISDFHRNWKREKHTLQGSIDLLENGISITPVGCKDNRRAIGSFVSKSIVTYDMDKFSPKGVKPYTALAPFLKDFPQLKDILFAMTQSISSGVVKEVDHPDDKHLHWRRRRPIVSEPAFLRWRGFILLPNEISTEDIEQKDTKTKLKEATYLSILFTQYIEPLFGFIDADSARDEVRFSYANGDVTRPAVYFGNCLDEAIDKEIRDSLLEKRQFILSSKKKPKKGNDNNNYNKNGGHKQKNLDIALGIDYPDSPYQVFCDTIDPIEFMIDKGWINPAGKEYSWEGRGGDCIASSSPTAFVVSTGEAETEEEEDYPWVFTIHSGRMRDVLKIKNKGIRGHRCVLLLLYGIDITDDPDIKSEYKKDFRKLNRLIYKDFGFGLDPAKQKESYQQRAVRRYINNIDPNAINPLRPNFYRVKDPNAREVITITTEQQRELIADRAESFIMDIYNDSIVPSTKAERKSKREERKKTKMMVQQEGTGDGKTGSVYRVIVKMLSNQVIPTYDNNDDDILDQLEIETRHKKTKHREEIKQDKVQRYDQLPYCIIEVPTRELAVGLEEEINQYCRDKSLPQYAGHYKGRGYQDKDYNYIMCKEYESRVLPIVNQGQQEGLACKGCPRNPWKGIAPGEPADYSRCDFHFQRSPSGVVQNRSILIHSQLGGTFDPGAHPQIQSFIEGFSKLHQPDLVVNVLDDSPIGSLYNVCEYTLNRIKDATHKRASKSGALQSTVDFLSSIYDIVTYDYYPDEQDQQVKIQKNTLEIVKQLEEVIFRYTRTKADINKERKRLEKQYINAEKAVWTKASEYNTFTYTTKAQHFKLEGATEEGWKHLVESRLEKIKSMAKSGSSDAQQVLDFRQRWLDSLEVEDLPKIDAVVDGLMWMTIPTEHIDYIDDSWYELWDGQDTIEIKDYISIMEEEIGYSEAISFIPPMLGRSMEDNIIQRLITFFKHLKSNYSNAPFKLIMPHHLSKNKDPISFSFSHKPIILKTKMPLGVIRNSATDEQDYITDTLSENKDLVILYPEPAITEHAEGIELYQMVDNKVTCGSVLHAEEKNSRDFVGFSDWIAETARHALQLIENDKQDDDLSAFFSIKEFTNPKYTRPDGMSQDRRQELNLDLADDIEEKFDYVMHYNTVAGHNLEKADKRLKYAVIIAAPKGSDEVVKVNNQMRFMGLNKDTSKDDYDKNTKKAHYTTAMGEYLVTVLENRYLDPVMEADRQHLVTNPLRQAFGRIRPTLWPGTKAFIFTNLPIPGVSDKAYLFEKNKFHEYNSFEEIKQASVALEEKIKEQVKLADDLEPKRKRVGLVIEYLKQQWSNGIKDLTELTELIKKFVADKSITEINTSTTLQPLVTSWIETYCVEESSPVIVETNTDKVRKVLSTKNGKTRKEIVAATNLSPQQVDAVLKTLKSSKQVSAYTYKKKTSYKLVK